MKILRWMGLTLAVAGFSFFLWILAVDLGIVHELSQPAKVKKIIGESGLYNSAINTVLDQKKDNGQQNTIKINGQDVATNDPIIKTAANDAFPPSLVQQNVEQVIDSFSSWMNGQTDKPNFKIDLSGAKATFAKDVGSGLQARVATLPACTDASTAANFNPFSASCVPKGANTAAIVSAFQNDFTTSKEFLGDPVYTADNLKDDKGQPIFNSEKAKDGRSKYDRVKSSPVVLGFLAVLFGLAVFFLSSTRRRGLRRIGIVLLFNGLIILLFTVLINSAINRVKVSASSDQTSKALQESVIKAAKSAITDLNKIYYVLGGVYAGVGLALIIGSIVVKRGSGKATEAHQPTLHKPTILDDETKPMPDEELEPEPEPKPEKPKPAPKPKATPKPKPAVTKINVS